jgi:uncharacterized protein
MRTISFIIFFGTVFIVTFLVNYYIFIRGWQALPSGSRGRSIFLVIFFFLALAYLAGRIIENYHIGQPASFLIWTGSFWLSAMLYFFMILVMIDLVRLINIALPVIPASWLNDIAKTRMVLFTGSIIVVTLVVLSGHINTWYPVINRLEISLDGRDSQMDSFTMALVSDIHLGTLTSKHRIKKMVSRINSLEPDIIVLAGDILDEDVGPVIHKDLGSAIKDLNAPLGVFGVTGNHEFIGGIDEAAEYLTSHGIKLIRDSVVKINNSFYLAGREDLAISQFTGMNRKSLEDLMKMAEDDLPVIMLDHQPYNLDRSAAAGVDLQLSGHTHHGQLWPFNFITRAVYSISRGYGEIEGMKVYVSNGIGTWGPPVRTGSRPEIVLLTVNINNR